MTRKNIEKFKLAADQAKFIRTFVPDEDNDQIEEAWLDGYEQGIKAAIQELPLAYKRSSSGTSDKEIARKRAEFQDRQAKLKAQRTPARITPPRYDEQFDRAMAIMDSDE